MILVSHRWSHHANHWYQDPTQRGLLTGITLSNKHSKIRLLSSYWPVPHAANQHSLSLHAHVVQFLHQNNPLKDSPDLAQHHPLTYIQELIMRETHKHQRQANHQTLLLGDLNSSWIDSDKGALTQPFTGGPTAPAGETLDERSPTNTLTPAFARIGHPSPQSRGSTTYSCTNLHPHLVCSGPT